MEADHSVLSIARQCTLLGLPRSSFYAPPSSHGESEENLILMRWLDEQYTKTPFYGSPKMTFLLKQAGHVVNHKRIERLMRTMGLRAIAPSRATSTPAPGHTVYPYLLRGVKIEAVNEVWSTDITYIRLRHGFVFLVAVIDWFSRFVLAWELSNTQDADFCVSALESALQQGTPALFNTDQGAQFTSEAFTGRLKKAAIQISMDGRGRALDNIFTERLWRTVKYEEVVRHEAVRRIVWPEIIQIRPVVPSTVPYEVRRQGNSSSKALGQCIHRYKTGTFPVRGAVSLPASGGEELGWTAWLA